MSRLFEALSNEQAKPGGPRAIPSVIVMEESAQAVEREQRSPNGVAPALVSATEAPPAVSTVDAVSEKVFQKETDVVTNPVEPRDTGAIRLRVPVESRLVALTDPNSLGAEKFRALVTRLDFLRKQRELNSIQVTSSVINEGKSLVAGNLAATLAKYSSAKTLLIEGDLHRPTLATLLGINGLNGVSQWWSGDDREFTDYVHRLDDMPLWFLAAGKPCDRPSDILRSARFANAFTQLAKQFEWIVVDSTPMLPIVDVNLWSRLVDGTLLVVREGVAPLKALKKGLQALDHPKLIGVVMNDTSGSDQANYDGQYYGSNNT